MNRESKAKHTQGKWEVSPCNEHDDLHYICSIPNNIVVARTCYATQSEANARLIAEAPTMYEAIQEFCDRVERGEVRSKRTYTKFKELIKKIEG